MIQITLQYFDDCPNWETTDRHIATLAEGLDATIGYELIDSYEAAVESGFRGSPTVLINGVDAFADRNAQIGLACRVYTTEDGPAGSPTLDQLRRAIAEAETRS
ncbi:MAG: thioredoxin family protein [Acidimicrobiia bacterium]